MISFAKFLFVLNNFCDTAPILHKSSPPTTASYFTFLLLTTIPYAIYLYRLNKIFIEVLFRPVISIVS